MQVPVDSPTLEFEVIQESNGAYVAACFAERIYADGRTLEELHNNVNLMLDAHFEGRQRPSADTIRLVVYQESPDECPATA